jgi:hypothetical protein
MGGKLSLRVFNTFHAQVSDRIMVMIYFVLTLWLLVETILVIQSWAEK